MTAAPTLLNLELALHLKRSQELQTYIPDPKP